MINADYFAYHQYRDYLIYKKIEEREKNPEFKAILQKLIEQEKEDFDFWRVLATKKDFHVGRFDVWKFRFLRKLLGLTFMAKFLESRERKMIAAYSAYAKTVDPALQEKIQGIIAHERFHEDQLIKQIKEDKVEFISSIVLGLNDGLIELTGALVGFSFALREPLLVALVGFITGLSASMSMSASAYMQAQYEPGKDPKKAAFFTGLAYIMVVLLLVSPFLLVDKVGTALLIMAVSIGLIITGISFYTSVLFDRPFLRQLGEMATFSIGVAVVTFVLGLVLRQSLGVEI